MLCVDLCTPASYFPAGESEYVDVTLKIVNREFNQSLADRTSLYFRDMATAFCQEVGAIGVCYYLKNVSHAPSVSNFVSRSELS